MNKVLEKLIKNDPNFYYKIEVIFGTKLSVVDKSELLRYLNRMNHIDGNSLWGDILLFGRDYGYGSEKFCREFDENIGSITEFWLGVLREYKTKKRLQ